MPACDPLLAIVLESSVYPDDVQAAAAFVARGGRPADFQNQGWEPSVVGLAEVSDALNMLNAYPEWTAAIGTAFLTQGEALIESLQTMRRRAWDNGTLQTTPQQVVAQDGTTIIIQPANPQVIYMPVVVRPDPGAVVVAGVIGFGAGVAAGGAASGSACCASVRRRRRRRAEPAVEVAELAAVEAADVRRRT